MTTARGVDPIEPLRARHRIVDETVAALPGTALTGTTAQERYRAFRRSQPESFGAIERLVPRVVREIRREPAAFAPPAGAAVDGLAEEVERLGPWRVPFELAGGLVTMPASIEREVSESRILYRRELVVDTVCELLGDDLGRTSFLDIGCNAGYFSLELAARGAGQVDGIDLRTENIAQARFLASHYGLDNVHFDVVDVDAMADRRRWDVALNLGVLYHVVDPLQLLRRTYDQCRRFAVIDTVCHREPVSAFFLLGDKDVDVPTEGRERYEMHPTYRAVVDGLRFAGFSEIVELEGLADPPHDLYHDGRRRCFLAFR